MDKNREQNQSQTMDMEGAEHTQGQEQVPGPGWDEEADRESIRRYTEYLVSKGKSKNTLEKYARDIRTFQRFNQGRPLDSQSLDQYRDYLSQNYKPASANSMLVALNQYLNFLGQTQCRLHLLQLDPEAARDRDKELTQEDYIRLVEQAGKNGNRRLFCILQTLGCTGIRVGELPFITVECLEKKTAAIEFNGRTREILLPDSLVRLLQRYCQETGVISGPVFVTRTGKPLDRRNVWKEMKQLCGEAGVDSKKVFPFNFRHLFASSFFARERDISCLTDYLGQGGNSGQDPMTGQVKESRERPELDEEPGTSF